MIEADYDSITESLWVGTYLYHPEDIEAVAAEGVTAVMSLQSDDDLEVLSISEQVVWTELTRRGIAYKRVPITDFSPRALVTHLEEAVDALAELMDEGKRVYLHCTAGINRSATVAIAYLVLEGGLGVDEAVATVSEARPKVAPYREVLKKLPKMARRRARR